MEGINLGSVYAKVMVDTSGMAAGIADARRQLDAVAKITVDFTTATRQNTQALSDNARATINNRDRRREQAQDIKNTEKAIKDLSSALKEQMKIDVGNNIAKGAQTVKAYDQSLKDAEITGKRFSEGLKQRLQLEQQETQARLNSIKSVQKEQSVLAERNATSARTIIDSGPQARREAEVAMARAAATRQKILSDISTQAVNRENWQPGATQDRSGLGGMFGLHSIGFTARMIGSEMSSMGDRTLGALAGAVKRGADFNQTLVQIRNNTVMTDKEFAEMSDQTKQLGVETGAAMDQIAMGARHIRDYGFTGKAAMDQLSIATKAAVATQSDAGDTAQLLSRVMRVFNIDESKAAGAMNALWFAAANSNLMMKQLVDTSGRAFAMAGPMGISFEQVASAISVFAHQGLNGSQAATQLINDLKKLHAPTKQTSDYLDFLATKAGPDLRAAFTTAGLQANQISGSFQLIAEKAKAAGIPLAEMLTHLFPGLRGETGALIGTTGQGLAGMHASLAAVAEMMAGRSIPLTDRYAQAKKQLGIQLNIVNNAFTVMASTIAERLVPRLVPLLDYVRQLAQWFGKLPVWVQDGTLAFVGMAAITLTLGGRLLSMVGTIYQIRAAMIAMGAQGITTIGVLGGIAAGLARIALFIPKPTHDFKDALKKQVLQALPPDARAKLAQAEAAIPHTVAPAIPGLDKNLTVGNPPNEFKQWLQAQKDAAKAAREAASEARKQAREHVKGMKDLELDMAKLQGPEAYSFAKALQEFYEGKKRGVPLDQLTERLRKQAEKAVDDAKKVAVKMDKALAETYKKSGEKIAEERTAAEQYIIEAGKTAAMEFTYNKEQQERRARNLSQEWMKIFGRAQELFQQGITSMPVINQFGGMPEEALPKPIEHLGLEAMVNPTENTDTEKRTFPDEEKKKVEQRFNVWRDAANRMKRDFANIFTQLFEDIFNGHKNFFKSFLNAFKEMLIKMAAELAASAVMRGLSGLFGGGGKKKSGGGGTGAAIGSLFGPEGSIIGGIVGGLFGFAEGGRVPGPLGMPQLATVHGGEFVVSNRMQDAGAMGNVTVHLGGVTVAGDYDVDRMMDRIAWHAKRRLAVNPGTA